MEAIDKKRIGYCRKLARSVIQRYEKEHGIINPPVPIEDIARWSGFSVELLERIGDEHSALMLNDQKLIGINKNHHVHRRRFSLGHELGHFYLDHPPEDDCDEEEIKLYNQEADEFSSELLIPLHLLKESLKDTTDINLLSKLFLVSSSAMTVKMISQRKLFSI